MGLRLRFVSSFFACSAFVILFSFPTPGRTRDRKDAVQYGAGVIVNVPSPEADVLQAVEQVVQNGIIRGSKEYSKDEYIKGATQVADSPLFPAWTEGGKVFFKVRFHAIDPLNFKDGADMGTLAVRYVVMPQGDANTVVRIDAVFAEDFRHSVHASNGSVEGSEYKDIHDHLEAIQLMKQEAADAEHQKQESARKKILAANSEPSGSTESLTPPNEVKAPAPETTIASTDELKQRVQELRKQTERLVKAPGAPLKTAPFHTAGNLKSLPAGTQVLIVIATPYWYGVETRDGEHGWMLRSDLQELP